MAPRAADYFGTMLSGTWAHLKRRGTDGKPNEPVVKFTAKADGSPPRPHMYTCTRCPCILPGDPVLTRLRA